MFQKLLKRNEFRRPIITRNRRVPIAVGPVVPIEPPISQSIIKRPVFRRSKRRVRKLRIHGMRTAINIRQPIGFPIILDELPVAAAHRRIRTRRKSRIQAIRAKNLNLFGHHHHHRSFLDPEDKSEAAQEPLNLKPPKYARFNAPHATKPHDPDEIQTLLRILQDEQATRRFVKGLSQKHYIHLKDIIVGLRRKIKKSRRYRPRSWGRRSNHYHRKHYPRSRARTSFHRRHGYRRGHRRGHRYGRDRLYVPYRNRSRARNSRYKLYRDTPISHASKKSKTDKQYQKVWKRVGKHKDGARFWDPEIIRGKVWKPKAIHRHLLEDMKMINAKNEKKKELMMKKKKKEKEKKEEEEKRHTKKRSKERKKFGKKLKAKARGRKAGRKSEGRRRTTKPPDVMEWTDRAIERSGYRYPFPDARDSPTHDGS